MIYLPSNYKFSGYQKIQTYQILNRIGCPVLKSVLLDNNDDITESTVDNIKSYLADEYCTVRYQYISPNSKPVRGGNKVKISSSSISNCIVPNTILWLLEPTNRLANQCSLNMCFSRYHEKLTFECVGKGFDTSNINRGDISPHQTIEFRLPIECGHNLEWWKYAKFDFMKGDAYEKTKTVRLKNIQSLGYRNYGRELFDEMYTPLQISQIEKLLGFAKLIYSSRELENEEEFIANCSILENGNVVFWDIATPIGKLHIYRDFQIKI